MFKRILITGAVVLSTAGAWFAAKQFKERQEKKEAAKNTKENRKEAWKKILGNKVNEFFGKDKNK